MVFLMQDQYSEGHSGTWYLISLNFSHTTLSIYEKFSKIESHVPYMSFS
jgi:hypothetical protein